MSDGERRSWFPFGRQVVNSDQKIVGQFQDERHALLASAAPDLFRVVTELVELGQSDPAEPIDSDLVRRAKAALTKATLTPH